MSDGDELLLERDHTIESCNAGVTVLRSLKEHPGYKLFVREMRLRGKISVAALTEVDPDKPGRTGKLQGAAASYNEMAHFVDEAINGLNERRDQMQQDAAAQLIGSNPDSGDDGEAAASLPRRQAPAARRLAQAT